MTRGPCWRDAANSMRWLEGRETCAEILQLLARLPLLEVAVLQQLFGLRGAASVYRSVARLEQAGLVATIQPPVYRTHSPRLLYLTDLGLAALALDQDVEPQHLAPHLRLRGQDLLALVPRLPDLLAIYELLGALAASRPGRPGLLAWERPWRRSYLRPLGKTVASVALPAHAVLSWDQEIGSYLLLPDRGILPPRLYRSTLDQLLLFRRFRDGHLPSLIIATTSRERMQAWTVLLEEVARARREASLAAQVTRWSYLDRSGECFPAVSGEGQKGSHARPIRLPRFRERRAGSRLPTMVGDALAMPSKSAPDASLGQNSLPLTATDHDLLELVGLHPFLSPLQLSDVLGWEVASVRRRMNRLMNLNLMRRLTAEEAGTEAAGEMIELTEMGLELVAARIGLSLSASIRELGLTGGGPDHPLGPRRKLLRTLAHTREVDDMFVRFYRTARAQVALGSDDAVEEWQNPTACSRRHLRPDGYGVYRRRGVAYGFFLELDRGTMNGRDYVRKFAAYYHYAVTGRFQRDYQGYPTILFVTSSNCDEDRVVRVARAAAVGRPTKLPLFLTCRWRIEGPNNPDGLLGPIWREPDRAFDARERWFKQ